MAHVNSRLPDAKELEQVCALKVFDEDGKEVLVGDIVGGGGGKNKTVLVFIRAFLFRWLVWVWY